MKLSFHIPTICVFGVSLVLMSCHTQGSKTHLYATSNAANNTMMVLNDDVDALGERRMEALTKTYPDVVDFLKDKGRPTYIAESKDRNDHMIVFYYPERKNAYACRYVIGSTVDMEFSGPFPIAPEEMSQLRRLAESHKESFSIKRLGMAASNRKH